MPKIRYLSRYFCIACTVILLCLNTAPAHAASTIALGVYPGYTFPADIDSYTNLVGRKPDVVFWFQSWSEPLYYSSQMSGIDARGVTPQITWSPEGISLSSLNSGSYDSYITTQALAAKSYGKPMQIRLAHEFNGSWQTFCPCVSSQTNAEFITFWRHVVDIFRSNGANNVSWVWSPNVYVAGSSTGARPFDAMYPGDSYVDWIALDGYNFGPPNNPWESLLQVFKPSYDDITALSTKPLQIAEWGSNEDGGDKAAWIRQGFLTDLPNSLPRIVQVDSFDKVAESDFRINSSDATLAAYKEVVNDPRYGGPQPVSSSSTPTNKTPTSATPSPGATSITTVKPQAPTKNNSPTAMLATNLPAAAIVDKTAGLQLASQHSKPAKNLIVGLATGSVVLCFGASFYVIRFTKLRFRLRKLF